MLFNMSSLGPDGFRIDDGHFRAAEEGVMDLPPVSENLTLDLPTSESFKQVPELGESDDEEDAPALPLFLTKSSRSSAFSTSAAGHQSVIDRRLASRMARKQCRAAVKGQARRLLRKYSTVVDPKNFVNPQFTLLSNAAMVPMHGAPFALGTSQLDMSAPSPMNEMAVEFTTAEPTSNVTNPMHEASMASTEAEPIEGAMAPMDGESTVTAEPAPSITGNKRKLDALDADAKQCKWRHTNEGHAILDCAGDLMRFRGAAPPHLFDKSLSDDALADEVRDHLAAVGVIACSSRGWYKCKWDDCGISSRYIVGHVIEHIRADEVQGSPKKRRTARA
ncbi:hypothetical protein BD626DRAFT_541220 [Schizophyllum amplum]|uniref:Uncharacterized protein n=1 Tax=Schizophyllum amplum TaxID=97359 RepID=A0A550BVH4_9AGAR|nr:hypothetical protein BD626DRAFT_541220 [Auriculariopsis ampla]